jgi:putative hemolysin
MRPTAPPERVTSAAALTLGSRASLYTCWAQGTNEIRAAQRLRRSVFFDEMGARPTDPASDSDGFDADHFDAFCDHLLVKVRDPGGASDDAVVGTYRVLSPHGAARAGGYYTDTEFHMHSWHALRHDAAELGRSCVHGHWRRGGVIMMLWSALGAYMHERGLSTLIGCCSVALTDDGTNARSLWSRLSRTHLVNESSRVVPKKPFELGPPSGAPSGPLSDLAMPPLMKGYLRCGARLLGPPAHDTAFNTADFPMMLQLSDLSPSYRQHFMTSAN